MNNDHINIIISHIDDLIQLTNYNILMKECLKRRLLFDVMQQQIQKYSSPEERHRRLFLKITKRGPDAFNVLLSILNDYFIEAARLLMSASKQEIQKNININDNKNNNTNNNNNNSNYDKEISIREMKGNRRKLDSQISVDGQAYGTMKQTKNIIFQLFEDPVHPAIELNVIKSTKIHYHPKVECYPMKSRNRGVFFLVNIIHFANTKPRNGATVDRDNLITLFRGMGFKIYYYEDVTSTEFYYLIDNLIKSRELLITDCLVFGLLTHGELKDDVQYVEFTDGSATNIKLILDQFNNINCKNLFNKPKIFLFPFCRGNISDTGIVYTLPKPVETDSAVGRLVRENVNVATYTDMHICYAAARGFRTHRDPNDGSWYVELMCKIYAEHAHDSTFDDLLKLVGRSVDQRRSENKQIQTVSNENIGFNKVLYFNPGFYED